VERGDPFDVAFLICIELFIELIAGARAMADATIVFVHTGAAMPAYAFDAIRQAALFTTGRILLVAPSSELSKAPRLERL
jgi:hypothetical protein